MALEEAAGLLGTNVRPSPELRSKACKLGHAEKVAGLSQNVLGWQGMQAAGPPACST